VKENCNRLVARIVERKLSSMGGDPIAVAGLVDDARTRVARFSEFMRGPNLDSVTARVDRVVAAAVRAGITDDQIRPLRASKTAATAISFFENLLISQQRQLLSELGL
jgi:hypothetical protein